MLTTTQAAAELGVTPRRMRQIIAAGDVKTTPNPNRPTEYMIAPADLKAVRVRPTGRPRKTKGGAQ